ncbi:MAG: adenylate/guanylate cyclase domain-containing protein, partial [Solirubrobacteraceae bacterium]
PVTLTEAAHRAGVTPGTLRRWARQGLIPRLHGADWTPGAVAQARVVARMRARGHSLAQIGRAVGDGRLAFGLLDEIFPIDPRRRTVAQAARAAGLARPLARRLMRGLGIAPEPGGMLSEDEVALLRHAAAALDAGFPLDALVQLTRVYGQAMAAIADAEVRLVHLHVHEPLMRSGASGEQIAQQLDDLNRRVLPLIDPVLGHLHRRHLRFFAEQDAISHLDADADADAELGRLRVAIAFADLADYTRMTEEQGEDAAVDAVEQFVAAIEASLPDDARVVKTIGDEAMIVATDTAALTAWAVWFQRGRRPVPRIAIHAGAALYREGDWFGRDVNIASRLAAWARAGQVLVTRAVADAAAGGELAFDPVGKLALKGLDEPVEALCAR